MNYLIETARLGLREWQLGEEETLTLFLSDPEVMYAYEHVFSEKEVHNWLKWNLESYQKNGFGLWAVEEKQTGIVLGECGLTLQTVNEKEYLEIGYHLKRAHWHKGYAIEAAKACKEFAFSELLAKEVVSIVRDTNIPSMNVAIRNQMTIRKRFIKDYWQQKMPHYLFAINVEVFNNQGK